MEDSHHMIKKGKRRLSETCEDEDDNNKLLHNNKNNNKIKQTTNAISQPQQHRKQAQTSMNNCQDQSEQLNNMSSSIQKKFKSSSGNNQLDSTSPLPQQTVEVNKKRNISNFSIESILRIFRPEDEQQQDNNNQQATSQPSIDISHQSYQNPHHNRHHQNLFHNNNNNNHQNDITNITAPTATATTTTSSDEEESVEEDEEEDGDELDELEKEDDLNNFSPTPSSGISESSHSARRQQQMDPRLKPFECHLDNLDLWHRFHPLDTEMIITKQGRRMFPPVRVTFSLATVNGGGATSGSTNRSAEGSSATGIPLGRGSSGSGITSTNNQGLQLNTRDKYQVLMDILPYDNKRYRYAYHKSSWQKAGKADPPSPTKLFLHPDGPFTLEQLKRQVISFEKIKLTNNDANKHGFIVLNSMHKYQPRIHLVLWRGKESHNLANAPISALEAETYKTFIFSETIFTAVTAYQNHSITKLKIDSNPFAKGFRDSSRLTDLELESMQDLISEGQCPFSPPRAPNHGFPHFLFSAGPPPAPGALQMGGPPGSHALGGPGSGPMSGEDPSSALLRERTIMALDSFLQQQQAAAMAAAAAASTAASVTGTGTSPYTTTTASSTTHHHQASRITPPPQQANPNNNNRTSISQSPSDHQSQLQHQVNNSNNLNQNSQDLKKPQAVLPGGFNLAGLPAPPYPLLHFLGALPPGPPPQVPPPAPQQPGPHPSSGGQSNHQHHQQPQHMAHHHQDQQQASNLEKLIMQQQQQFAAAMAAAAASNHPSFLF